MNDRLRATREELAEIARELGLSEDPGDTKWLLWSRIMDRSKTLWRLALSEEQSDPERKDWPWSE